MSEDEEDWFKRKNTSLYMSERKPGKAGYGALPKLPKSSNSKSKIQRLCDYLYAKIDKNIKDVPADKHITVKIKCKKVFKRTMYLLLKKRKFVI